MVDGGGRGGDSSDRFVFLPSKISKSNQTVCNDKDSIFTARLHRTRDAQLSRERASEGEGDGGNGQRQASLILGLPGPPTGSPASIYPPAFFAASLLRFSFYR